LRGTVGVRVSEGEWKRERGRRSRFVSNVMGRGDGGVEAGMRNWFGMWLVDGMRKPEEEGDADVGVSGSGGGKGCVWF
jgi:hypothetical protein